MKTLLGVAVFLAFSQQAFCQINPSDKSYPRNPGLTPVGSIPSPTIACAALPAANGSENDAGRIQNTIETCLCCGRG